MATGDGMTNPAASGTHTRASLSADDDGGYLRDRVGAYYDAGGLSLVPGDDTPPPPPDDPPGGDPTPPPAVTFATGSTAKPDVVRRRDDTTIRTHVRASGATSVLLDVEIYGPARPPGEAAHVDREPRHGPDAARSLRAGT